MAGLPRTCHVQRGEHLAAIIGGKPGELGTEDIHELAPEHGPDATELSRHERLLGSERPSELTDWPHRVQQSAAFSDETIDALVQWLIRRGRHCEQRR